MNLMLALVSCFVTLPPQQSWLDISKDWRFQPDPEHVGLQNGWDAVTYDDTDWTTFNAGERWEDHGFPDVDGYGWFRRWVDVPEDWADAKVWLTLGGVNDACTIYCNGTRVNAYGDTSDRSVANVPIIAELSAFVTPGKRNLVAIECLDWGGSGGLWHLPCALTTDINLLPVDSVVACVTEYEAKRILATVDLTGLGNDRPGVMLHLGVFKGDKDHPAADASIALPEGWFTGSAFFDLKGPDAGNVFHLRLAEAESDTSALAGLTIDRPVPWPEAPGWEGDYADLEVENNFVTNLLRVKLDAAGGGDYPILNPRDGWVFISARTDQDIGPQVVIDGETNPVAWRRNPETSAYEAMRYLAQGKHNVAVASNGEGPFEVRAVPELAYCYYPASPHIKPFGPYDWPFVSRYVLPHVNTIVTAGPEADALEQWRNEGRAWLSNASLPGLSSPRAPTADEVYQAWSANPGFAKPGYSGIIVDEFLFASPEHYAAWTEAVERLHANPDFAGHKFYAWCGNLYEFDTSATFRKQVADLGYRFAWEKYLAEEPTEARATSAIARNLQQSLVEWQKTMPDVAQRLVMTLGYMSAPPESLNLNPAVDYHVFMDMQFERLATEPAFWGLYGVMEYSSSYTDEESLRWAHQLFRHYCIEGNRERMTDDPYVLPHIQNPDFVDDLNGWYVAPAKEGAVAPETMDGFGWLQGRYPDMTVGNRICRMTRSNERPNRISQTVNALEPGRLYSVKAIAADIDNLDKKQTIALRIQVEGAEPVPDYGFSYAYPSNYAHEFGPYNRDHPAWFTFQRYVFRAGAETATLHIMDWIADDTPGGDAGQNVGFNFIEVQPFHAP